MNNAEHLVIASAATAEPFDSMETSAAVAGQSEAGHGRQP